MLFRREIMEDPAKTGVNHNDVAPGKDTLIHLEFSDGVVVHPWFQEGARDNRA
jgi:hypothetical protein